MNDPVAGPQDIQVTPPLTGGDKGEGENIFISLTLTLSHLGERVLV